MIIQCEQCRTRFRLDDAKIKGRGVKVRCSKCRHVFLVRNEEQQPETSFGELLGRFEDAAPQDRSAFDTSAMPDGVAGFGETSEAPSLPVEEAVAPPQSPASAAMEPSPSVPTDEFDFSFDAADAEWAQGEAPAPPDVRSGKDSGLEESFDFPPISVPAVDQADTEDFTIDFGELAFSQDSAPGGAQSPVETAVSRDTFNLDFDDLLGGEPRPLVGTGASSPTDIGLDEDIFSAASSQPAKDGGEGFGALDFSDLDLGELPSSATANQGGKSSVEGAGEETVLVGGAAAAPVAAPSPMPEFAAVENEELPPLTISSRRKGASFFPAAVTIAAIIFVVILAGIGFVVVSGPESMKKMGLGFLTTLTGGEAQDEGKISLGKVTAEFVANMEAGELFVIRGETINNYGKPRASIQVKATLLGANGQPILSKPAYCGNSLTKDQLTMLSMTKIEEVMNNQFGDSLSNLGVQPGKSIPFVVVFANVPKDAADFSVSVVGSTVAAK